MSNALRFNFGRQSFHSITTWALTLVAVGLSGCASISPAPFNSLSSSVQQLRGGADASLGMVTDLSRERYIAEGAAGDTSNYAKRLQLTEKNGDRFGWISPNPPLFLKAAQFREGLYQLNSVLVDYTNLLAQLASPDLVAPSVFDGLARDLNSNLRNAASTLSPKSSDKEIAIISTASTAAFRAYLQHRQRASLISALKNNQAAFSNVASLGENAVEIEEKYLLKEYQDASHSISTALLQPALSVKQKEVLLRKLVKLDEKLIKELAVLKALHQSYKALPAAHSELAKGLANPKLGLPMIQEIFENSQRLYRLYEELRKAEGEIIPSNAVS